MLNADTHYALFVIEVGASERNGRGGRWRVADFRNNQVSARYVTEMLGLEEAKPWGPFMVVEMGNGVSLDYHDFYDLDGEILPQHYAFLVTEDDFNEIFGRIEAGGQDYWADPGLSTKGEINNNDEGRGVYFQDPDGHLLEIITRPYGSGLKST